MGKIQIYHNPRCGKSRTALQFLNDKGVDFEVVEYLKSTPSEEELRSLLMKLGKKPLDIIRKKEAVFISEFKDKKLSDDEWIRVVVANPILIERPIVLTDSSACIVRDEKGFDTLASIL